jgi:signal transduction histidine kinase
MKNALRLLPNETIVLKFRKHVLMLLYDTAGTLIVMFLPFILFATLAYAGYLPVILQTPQIAAFASALWLLMVWCALAVLWTDYYLDMWIVTDRRVINVEQYGLFHRNVSARDIDRIQEMTVRTDNFIQTFFNYGTLQIQTSGPSADHSKIVGVPNPEKIRAVIMEQENRVVALEKMNQSQEKLIHTVSHELKGYLTKDAAALAAIAEDAAGAGGQKMQDLAKRALQETRRGVSAAMQVLGGFNTRTGEIVFDISTFDFNTLIASLCNEFELSAQEKGLTFQRTLERPPHMLRGDETKLRELVFRPLFENALKYTQKGGISVSLLSHDGLIRFAIQDTGVGISESDMKRLFMPGGRGTNSRAVNPDSTGYGLAIAKTAVDAHQGKIWALSKGESLGATFVVELPLG